VPYTTAAGQQQLLDTVAQAAERLGLALAALGELYEHLDELSAERMEEQLFAPVRLAYGRARRAHTTFAERHGLSSRALAPAPAVAPGHSVKNLVEDAVSTVSGADRLLAELQDSMLPIEVGDPQVRADLEQVRTLIDGLGVRARALERTLGR
jgi:hypothetical protein